MCRSASQAAHPRACGENARSPRGAPPATGSSPRVRGKHSRGFSDPPGAGLIPARAGKTTIPLIATAPLWAHPRACGENGPEHRRMLTWLGSSPRVRGKLQQNMRTLALHRLIPARAGKTTPARPQPHHYQAHPRACGENHLPAGVRVPQLGSSPRVRGKLQGPVHGDVGRGLIPARAGKTQGFIPALAGNRAHPRACGENPPWVWTAPRPAGSSPRVRGKPPRVRGKHQRSGLIPACAGKTAAGPPRPRRGRAHPRACGENPRSPARSESGRGSSPRVRGKPPHHEVAHHPGRLIPARAGKTWPQQEGRGVVPAHPRACGENVWGFIKPVVDVGSSPRVRGKRRRTRWGVCGRGLIPARAGKTVGHVEALHVCQAHPRACGENCLQCSAKFSQ